MKKWILILSFVLAGCAGEQALQNRHYLLPENPGIAQAQPGSPLLVVQMDLGNHLNSRSLIYRTSESEVVYAQHNLWAEDIEQQLTQRIINDLQLKQSSYLPVKINSALDLSDKQQLYIQLQKFNGAYTGSAEIAGEWFLLDKKGQVLNQYLFSLDVPLQQEGYAALISSLSAGIGQLSDLIVAELNLD